MATTDTWIGNASADWSASAANWSGAFPTSIINAIINTKDILTIGFGGGDTFIVNSLAVGNDFFDMSGGSLTIPGTASFADEFTLTGGTLRAGDALTGFFADKPVSLLWGVGAALQRRLAADGITLIGQLGVVGEREARGALWPDRSPPRPPRRGHRRPGRDRPCPGALDLGGNDPGARRSRRGDSGAHSVAALRARIGAFEGGVARGRIGHLEAQDQRFSPAHALAPLGRSHPVGRDPVSHRLAAARRRSRWNRTFSPGRGRRRRPGRRRLSRSADLVRPRSRPAAAARAGDRQYSRAPRRRLGAARTRLIRPRRYPGRETASRRDWRDRG